MQSLSHRMLIPESVVHQEMGAAISRFLVPALRPGGSHSSRPAIAGGLKQPTRESSGSGQAILPYLVLLRVGFSLPLRSPATRCALTAPFHPYQRTLRPAGGTFSVALIRETGFEPAPPAVSRHAALWRPDFASPAPNDSGETLDADATACRHPSRNHFLMEGKRARAQRRTDVHGPHR